MAVAVSNVGWLLTAAADGSNTPLHPPLPACWRGEAVDLVNSAWASVVHSWSPYQTNHAATPALRQQRMSSRIAAKAMR
jgi:hypothetical protein